MGAPVQFFSYQRRSRFAAVRSRFVAVRKWINGASDVSKADNSLRWKPKKDMSDIYPSWVFNSCNSNKVKVMPKEALSNKKVSRIIVSEVDSTNWSLVWPLKNNHEIPDKSSGTLYIYSWNQLFRNPGRGGKDRGWVFQQLHPWAGPASAARGEASAPGQPGERERESARERERMREFGREMGQMDLGYELMRMFQNSEMLLHLTIKCTFFVIPFFGHVYMR